MATVLAEFKSGKLDDTTFGTYAEQFVKQLEKDRRGEKFALTTTKLRGIYGLIMNLYTRINDPADFDKYRADIQYLKVKMAYEAGREATVKDFLQKTALMVLVDRIKTYEQFQLYCRYAESLVAYFKYYGGKDK
ncbi:MAG: type III-A CRISPR-associated protein Csm2 [Actinomycetes bacterium]|jgi:CRISPR-associated protein Csm2|nr:type III-A CRISPR-associated protein Csm2 [Actinomycetes bacterium]